MWIIKLCFMAFLFLLLLCFYFPLSPVPLFETDLDALEYRVHFNEGDTSRNLSCRLYFSPTDNTSLYQIGQGSPEHGDKVYLELHEKYVFPFAWEDWPEFAYLTDYISNATNFIFSSRTRRGDENASKSYSICSTRQGNNSLIGMVYWNPSDYKIVCQVYSNSRLISMPAFTVLVNPHKIRYTWVNVSTWKDIPRAAFIVSMSGRAHPSYGCNGHGAVTEKRYIGRLLSPERDPIILSVPEQGALPPGYPIDGLGVTRQVLVLAEPFSTKLNSLICQPATGAFNLSQYREEVGLEVKLAPGKESKMAKIIQEGHIFRKVEKKATLMWNYSHSYWWAMLSVYVGDAKKDVVFACRYRCISGRNECPSYSYPSNGRLLYRSIDRTLGHYTLNRRACQVPFNGTLYRTEYYDWLANPCYVKTSWTPLTGLSASNETVVVSEANGAKFAIGRLSRPGIGDIVSQVELASKKITLSDGSTPDWETVRGKVDILMTQE